MRDESYHAFYESLTWFKSHLLITKQKLENLASDTLSYRNDTEEN